MTRHEALERAKFLSKETKRPYSVVKFPDSDSFGAVTPAYARELSNRNFTIEESINYEEKTN